LGRFSAANRDAFLQQFFQQIDLLVAPTTTAGEGIPTVILEALAFGCPVLATRLGGTVCFELPWLRPPGAVVTLCELSEIGLKLRSLVGVRPGNIAGEEQCRGYFGHWFSDAKLLVRWRSFLETAPVQRGAEI